MERNGYLQAQQCAEGGRRELHIEAVPKICGSEVAQRRAEELCCAKRSDPCAQPHPQCLGEHFAEHITASAANTALKAVLKELFTPSLSDVIRFPDGMQLWAL